MDQFFCCWFWRSRENEKEGDEGAERVEGLHENEMRRKKQNIKVCKHAEWAEWRPPLESADIEIMAVCICVFAVVHPLIR